ncbi:HAD-IA family hydrolase [Agaricicola taiwanensis]|nr:HAD-IA family hydrolase [Agaricicola taiwanensis]
MTPRLVLFDVDGTLVDSQHMIVAAVTRAFEAEGLIPPEREAILSIVGLSLLEAMQTLGNHQPGFPAAALREHYAAAFTELRLAGQHDEVLFPGAFETVERLSRRDDLLLGIATGKSVRGVQRMLKTHGFEGRFLTIQTADDNPSKPDPAMVLRAMGEMGVTPQETVMIGDTAWDIRMARAAGVAAVGVGWGYHPDELLVEAGARCVLKDFLEVEAAVDAALAEADDLSLSLEPH